MSYDVIVTACAFRNIVDQLFATEKINNLKLLHCTLVQRSLAEGVFSVYQNSYMHKHNFVKKYYMPKSAK